MAGPQRRNACEACVQAKRACDRQTPRCGRCAGRDIECRHSQTLQTPPAKRARLAPRVVHCETPTSKDHPLTAMSSNRPRPFEFDDNFLHMLGVEMRDDCTITSILFPDKCLNRPSSGSASIGGKPCCDPSWFLDRGLWDIERRTAPPPLLPFSITKEFFKTFMDWLQQWAKTGRSPFIHPALHRFGHPSCLQDAYTTVTAYLAKTEDTEDMILRIIEDRASSLVKHFELLEGVETLDLTTHLARTQSLMVYTFIRLFDGCPRQRSLAEASKATLRQWHSAMLDAATNEVPRFFNVLERQCTAENELKNALWRAWILSESIRRTWLFASSGMALYEIMRDNWTECSGGLPFTARKGLWEAKSAVWWEREIQRNDPLMTTCGGVLDLMKMVVPGEVDSFARLVVRVLVEPDEMDAWEARGMDGGKG